MSIKYHRGDELPAWEATIVLPSAEDFGAGWEFTVTLAMPGEPRKVKTDGIVGSVNLVTVFWAEGDLDIAPGTWDAELTGTRTVDHSQFTITEAIVIEPRALV